MQHAHERNRLRKEALDRRDELDADIHENGSLRITELVIDQSAYLKASFLFLYLSYASEVETWLLGQEILDSGKKLCIPLINGPGQMEAREIKNLDTDIVPGPMGIPAPSEETNAIDPRLIDLVLAPGLLFDRFGARLGYGGGYYDRFLTHVRPKIEIWGLCFNEQISNRKLIRNEWDQPVTGLVTPSGFLKNEK